jgi:hypothetical protein
MVIYVVDFCLIQPQGNEGATSFLKGSNQSFFESVRPAVRCGRHYRPTEHSTAGGQHICQRKRGQRHVVNCWIGLEMKRKGSDIGVAGNPPAGEALLTVEQVAENGRSLSGRCVA